MTIADRFIPAPPETNHTDWWTRFPQIADKDIQVGDPATLSVGSDCYADTVYEIVRFKEGKRAGKIKYIRLSNKSDRYLAYPVVCREHKDKPELEAKYIGEYYVKSPCTQCWLQAHDAVYFSESADSWYLKVVVGHGFKYLDPHF